MPLQAADTAKAQGAVVAAVVSVAASPLGSIADIPVITPPGVNLFEANAVTTRILELMFNEEIFHCLASGNPSMMEKVSKVERNLNDERV